MLKRKLRGIALSMGLAWAGLALAAPTLDQQAPYASGGLSIRAQQPVFYADYDPGFWGSYYAYQANDDVLVGSQAFTAGLSGQLTQVNVAVARFGTETQPLKLWLFNTLPGGEPDVAIDQTGPTYPVPYTPTLSDWYWNGGYQIFDYTIPTGNPVNPGDVLASTTIAPGDVPLYSAVTWITWDVTASNIFVNPGDQLTIGVGSDALGSTPYMWVSAFPYGGGNLWLSRGYYGGVWQDLGFDVGFQTFVDPESQPVVPEPTSGVVLLVAGLACVMSRPRRAAC